MHHATLAGKLIREMVDGQPIDGNHSIGALQLKLAQVLSVPVDKQAVSYGEWQLNCDGGDMLLLDSLTALRQSAFATTAGACLDPRCSM